MANPNQKLNRKEKKLVAIISLVTALLLSTMALIERYTGADLDALQKEVDTMSETFQDFIEHYGLPSADDPIPMHREDT